MSTSANELRPTLRFRLTEEKSRDTVTTRGWLSLMRGAAERMSK
jgi:hypothetical protein